MLLHRVLISDVMLSFDLQEKCCKNFKFKKSSKIIFVDNANLQSFDAKI